MEIDEPIEMERPRKDRPIMYEYKTIENPYPGAFDREVNRAIEEGWKLENRFINRKQVYIAFMKRRKTDGV